MLPRIWDDNYNWVVLSGLQDEDNFRKYLFSLYWTLTTMLTVGFGDIHAYNIIEYIISILWMLFGVGFYSFTIGTLSSILVNIDTKDNILKNKLIILNEFCNEARIPHELKNRIKMLLVHNSQKNVFSWNDKAEVFSELPANIKFEISNTMRVGFLKDVAFFNNKDDAFIAMIVPFLSPQVNQERDIIYKAGDHPHSSIIY
jgi:hyperpolarization activated cyclic nucleotide-gated potassium channel 1